MLEARKIMVQRALAAGEPARQFYEKPLSFAGAWWRRNPAGRLPARPRRITGRIGNADHSQRGLNVPLQRQQAQRLSKADEQLIVVVEQQLPARKTSRCLRLNHSARAIHRAEADDNDAIAERRDLSREAFGDREQKRPRS